MSWLDKSVENFFGATLNRLFKESGYEKKIGTAPRDPRERRLRQFSEKLDKNTKKGGA